MYCQNRGSQLTFESTFCPSCGVKVAKVQPAAPAPLPAGKSCPQAQSGAQAPGGPEVNPPGSISWNMAIPIFRGEVFRQLGLVIGIPFGLLAIFLLVSAGGKSYGLYGAGLIAALLFLAWRILAGSRQDLFLSWKQLTRVTYKPRTRTILLRAGLTENIGLFRTGDNYASVEQFVRKRTGHLSEG